MAKRIWDDLIGEQDREVYYSTRTHDGVFGGRMGIGERPAVLVIDVLNKSIGDEPLPILEAIARFGPGCCGEYGWNATWKIRDLLDIARGRQIPIFYTGPAETRDRPEESHRRRLEKTKLYRNDTCSRDGWSFADEIAPQPGDVVVRKVMASGFYATELERELRACGVDTLLVTGCTTSGCVRATVLDGYAQGFKITLVEDGVFDRVQVSHAVNLFDMQAKYADVIPLKELKLRLDEARVAVSR